MFDYFGIKSGDSLKVKDCFTETWEDNEGDKEIYGIELIVPIGSIILEDNGSWYFTKTEEE